LKPGKTQFTLEGYSKLNEGSEYILFLQTKLGEYDISSLHEGKFNIDGKDHKEAEKVNRNQNYKKLKELVVAKYAK
jgi:hypothetical protein